MATNSIMGGVMQLINLLIVFVIWFPFLKAMDKLNLAKEKEQAVQNSAAQQNDNSIKM